MDEPCRVGERVTLTVPGYSDEEGEPLKIVATAMTSAKAGYLNPPCEARPHVLQKLLCRCNSCG